MEHGIVQMGEPALFRAIQSGRLVSRRNARIASRICSIRSWQAPPLLRFRWNWNVMSYAPSAAAPGLASSAAGHFATGGSEANFTSLICALTAAHPKFATRRRARLRRPVEVLCLPGLPHRLVENRAPGRHRTLGAAPHRHRRTWAAWTRSAGSRHRRRPRAGRGALPGGRDRRHHRRRHDRSAARLRRHRGTEHLWYHVDAAWGGAALASDRMRGLLSGIERADSLTIDAHKWFATTMGCAMFLTRHGACCRRPFMPRPLHAIQRRGASIPI
jgi:hypothetical protein